MHRLCAIIIRPAAYAASLQMGWMQYSDGSFIETQEVPVQLLLARIISSALEGVAAASAVHFETLQFSSSHFC